MVDYFDIEVLLIIMTVGIFGFICSVASLYIIYKKPLLHNAYGYICFASSASEGMVLLIFVLLTPVAIFIDKYVDESRIGLILGFFINFLSYNAQYLHLLKSINRFMAVVFFVKYRIFFTDNVTKILIIIVSIISIFTVLPYLIYECNYIFDCEIYVWDVRSDECIVGSIVDIPSVSISIFISLLCDIITFIYLHFGGQTKSGAMKNDIQFLIQASLTSLFYLIMMISFHIVSPLVESLLMIFLTNTLAWILCHTLNQLTFILFTICKKSKPSNVTIISSSIKK